MGSTFKVDDDVREVLARSNIQPDRVSLPPEQLDRKLYERVNKALTAAGGKWNRSAKAHLFDRDPREALGLAIETGEATDIKKALQAFYTPDPVAERMVKLAGIGPGMRVLEPSCGDGQLAMAAAKAMGKSGVIDCIDIDPVGLQKAHQRLTGLGRKDDTFTCVDFLTVGLDRFRGERIFDAVLINPPFTNGQDMEHVRHAHEFLSRTPGRDARLVAITFPSWRTKRTKAAAEFREFFARYKDQEPIELPAGTFSESGTDIPTVLIVLRALPR